MAYHQARKVKDAMDEAERRAITESEAAELAEATAEPGEVNESAHMEPSSQEGTVSE